MKIDKFIKDKRNTYKIIFDDETSIVLYDDVIVKYNLLVNKEIDKNTCESIVKYNDFLDGYYKSINYINKKLRTELEISKYLEKLCISKSDIEKIVALLYKDGYLNKDIYLKAYISDQYNLTSNGPEKIKKDLVNLGYEEKDIICVLNNYDWIGRIDKIIKKKIKITSKISNNALKTKILNDIIKLGYLREDVLCFLNKVEFLDDYVNLTRDLMKIKNKYSKKYRDYELESKVTNFLFRKGYNIEDIKRCYNEN